MPLPDEQALRDVAVRVRQLATTAEVQSARAAVTMRDTSSWISPRADDSRLRWSWADGKARTGVAELRAAAAHLGQLADAVADLRVQMGAARDQAREDLQEQLTSVGPGGQPLPGGIYRAELMDLPSSSDPYWSTVRPPPPVPAPVLPSPVGDGELPDRAPPGVVITIPEQVRGLADTWHTAGLTIQTERQQVATAASALPLAQLETYGLPGRRAGALLEDVLGTYGTAGQAVIHYQDAAELAVAAADAIDGLGETFLTTVGGVRVGTPDTAPQTLLDHFDLLDTAAEGGDADGVVSLADLEAAAADTQLPADVRAAAQAMLDDPAYFALIEDLSPSGSPGVPGDEVRAADIEAFLQLRSSTEALYDELPVLVELSGHPNDTVTVDGLRQALADGELDEQAAAAAAWLIDNPLALGVLGLGESSRSYAGDAMPTMFSQENAIRVLVAGHAFDGRPEQAQRFVDTLPVPVGGGNGLPLGMLSDRAVQSLANAALTAANGDLTEQVSVIGHLPETEGGVRNALISAMYARMGAQLDQVANGPLAGDPTQPGHSGANWMVIAPWASNGVRDPITGDFRALGIPAPYGARQAAADGNQWIFSDIGMRYAQFLEMYSGGGRPDRTELQAFFDASFDEGDAQIRAAFAAYAEVPLTDDPIKRQELMFQGNVLIAVHEQEGAQRWLEEVSVGPDSIATEFIELRIGDRTIKVKSDLPELNTTNNSVQARDLLSLDPGGRSPYDLAPTALDGVRLSDLRGVDDEDFPLSLAEMAQGGGGTTRPEAVVGSPFPVQLPVDNVPDSLAGTGASAWTDRDERMWSIVKLFEQTHTDRALYDPSVIDVGFDRGPNAWLDPATGLRP